MAVDLVFVHGYPPIHLADLLCILVTKLSFYVILPISNEHVILIPLLRLFFSDSLIFVSIIKEDHLFSMYSK